MMTCLRRFPLPTNLRPAFIGNVAALLCLGVLLLASGCIKEVTTTTRYGRIQYPFEVESRDPATHSDQNEKRTIKVIAFMPFINSPKLATSADLDIALANEQLSNAIAKESATFRIQLLGPLVTEEKMSSTRQTGNYASLLRDYSSSGLVDRRKVQIIARKLRADVLVQGQLEGYAVSTKFNAFKSASIRWLIFDGKTGQLRPVLVVKADQSYADMRREATSVEQNKSKAHIFTAVTGAMHIVGWVLFGVGLSSDNMGSLIAGTVMIFPVCFAPMAYSVGTRESRNFGAYDPPDTPLSIKEALGEIIKVSIRRILSRYGGTPS